MADTPEVPNNGAWSGVRVDFAANAHNQLIDSKGYRVRWEKASICPNRGSEDQEELDRHRINCRVCQDTPGWVYYDAKTVQALCTSVSLKEFYRTEGRFDIGTILVTLKSNFKLSRRDRVTMLDSRERIQEVFRRGEVGRVDKLKYKILTVDRLYTVKHDGVTVVDYVLDTDYVVNAEGCVEWKRPPPSSPMPTPLSIVYYRNPAYIVLDLLHSIRDTQVAAPGTVPLGTPGTVMEMPTQGMAKLDFLTYDETRTPG